MSSWSIKVLYYGKIHLPKGALTPNFDNELNIDVPYLGFLLERDGRKILVDSGIDDNFIVNGKAWGGFSAEGGRDHVVQALADAGAKPEEIETVIYTHLHNDHAAHAELFVNACVVFQKAEWLTLLDPLPIMKIRRDYDPSLIGQLKSMKCIKINGDMKWCDGINLYKIPGHTPGSQAVAVETDQGVKFMVGDHWHLNCMAFAHLEKIIGFDGNTLDITPAPPVYEGFIPSSLIYNYYDYYDSCNKLEALMKDFSPNSLMAGHEPSLVVGNDAQVSI